MQILVSSSIQRRNRRSTKHRNVITKPNIHDGKANFNTSFAKLKDRSKGLGYFLFGQKPETEVVKPEVAQHTPLSSPGTSEVVLNW